MMDICCASSTPRNPQSTSKPVASASVCCIGVGNAPVTEQPAEMAQEIFVAPESSHSASSVFESLSEKLGANSEKLKAEANESSSSAGSRSGTLRGRVELCLSSPDEKRKLQHLLQSLLKDVQKLQWSADSGPTVNINAKMRWNLPNNIASCCSAEESASAQHASEEILKDTTKLDHPAENSALRVPDSLGQQPQQDLSDRRSKSSKQSSIMNLKSPSHKSAAKGAESPLSTFSNKSISRSSQRSAPRSVSPRSLQQDLSVTHLAEKDFPIKRDKFGKAWELRTGSDLQEAERDTNQRAASKKDLKSESCALESAWFTTQSRKKTGLQGTSHKSFQSNTLSPRGNATLTPRSPRSAGGMAYDFSQSGASGYGASGSERSIGGHMREYSASKELPNRTNQGSKKGLILPVLHAEQAEVRSSRSGIRKVKEKDNVSCSAIGAPESDSENSALHRQGTYAPEWMSKKSSRTIKCSSERSGNRKTEKSDRSVGGYNSEYAKLDQQIEASVASSYMDDSLSFEASSVRQPPSVNSRTPSRSNNSNRGTSQIKDVSSPLTTSSGEILEQHDSDTHPAHSERKIRGTQDKSVQGSESRLKNKVKQSGERATPWSPVLSPSFTKPEDWKEQDCSTRGYANRARNRLLRHQLSEEREQNEIGERSPRSRTPTVSSQRERSAGAPRSAGSFDQNEKLKASQAQLLKPTSPSWSPRVDYMEHDGSEQLAPSPRATRGEGSKGYCSYSPKQGLPKPTAAAKLAVEAELTDGTDEFINCSSEEEKALSSIRALLKLPRDQNGNSASLSALLILERKLDALNTAVMKENTKFDHAKVEKYAKLVKEQVKEATYQIRNGERVFNKLSAKFEVAWKKQREAEKRIEGLADKNKKLYESLVRKKYEFGALQTQMKELRRNLGGIPINFRFPNPTLLDPVANQLSEAPEDDTAEKQMRNSVYTLEYDLLKKGQDPSKMRSFHMLQECSERLIKSHRKLRDSLLLQKNFILFYRNFGLRHYTRRI